MKINEIVGIADRDEFTLEFAYHFTDNDQQIIMPNNMILKISHQSDMLHFGVFNNDILVAYFSMHKMHDVWQSDMQSVDIQYRSQGLMRFCIEYAIKHFGPIICDTHQTLAGRQVWTALIKNPNAFLYYWYNIKTDEKIKLTWDGKMVVPNPWIDNDYNIVIYVTVKPLSEDYFIHLTERDEWRKKHNRQPTWLGTGFIEFNP